MNHQQLREMLPLLVYRELNERDKVLIEEHLDSCAACTKEFNEINEVHAALQKREAQIDADLLMEARRDFHTAMISERNKVSFWERLKQRFTVTTPDFAQVASALATLALGVFIGYIAFGRSPITQNARQQGINPETQPAPVQTADTHITNVRFIDSDPTDGQVEFEFDAIKPMRVKGNVNDPQVQKVLTYALVNAENPGVRLRAVDAFASQNPNSPDPQIEKALISALKSDDNPGVRKQALEVLQKFPMDEDIKQSFLYVLVHDRNAGMRVAAIKALQAQQQIDKDVVDVLRQKIQSDDNDYIRLKARDVLQEVKQKQ